MATYRLQPARTAPYGVLLCVIFALAIAAPVAVLAAFSQGPKHTEPLAITTPDTEWEQPVDGVDCAWDPEGLLLNSYVCGDTYVQINWVKDAQDSNQSLRRAVRSYTQTTLPQEPIVREGDAGVMVLPRSSMIAINMQNHDSAHAGEEFQILLQGHPQQLLPLAEKIWGSFTPTPLPVGIEDDFAQPPQPEIPLLNAQAGAALTMENDA